MSQEEETEQCRAENKTQAADESDDMAEDDIAPSRNLNPCEPIPVGRLECANRHDEERQLHGRNRMQNTQIVDHNSECPLDRSQKGEGSGGLKG